MSWAHKWSFAALHALRAMPLRQAEQVDRAVQHFAATGRGNFFRADDDPAGGRLYAGRYVAYLTFNFPEHVFWVRYIYRVG
jgi:hypothetical protein